MFGAKVSGSWQNGLAVRVLASAGDVIVFESFGWRGVVCPLAGWGNWRFRFFEFVFGVRVLVGGAWVVRALAGWVIGGFVFLSRFSGRGFWWAGNLVIFFRFSVGLGLVLSLLGLG